MLLNCGVGQDSWESLDCKEIQPVKQISPEYSLKGLMLKLKLQYFGHLMWRTDSLETSLMLGKIEGRKRRGWQRMRDGWMASVTQWTWVWASAGVGDGLGSLVCYSPWGRKELDMSDWLNWTEVGWSTIGFSLFFHISWFSRSLSFTPHIQTGD